MLNREANNVKSTIGEGKLEDKKVIIVSISPQSRASVAVKFKLGLTETAQKLTKFFKDLGVQHVFDTTFSRDFSLAESQREFVERLKNFQDGEKNVIPMLASACPGWVCYAEKTHGSYILPYISTTKSPQQIMGSLVKNYFATSLAKSPDQIYHVTVMPCYDKKLEASREDFYNDIYRTRDVDCVISTVLLLHRFSSVCGDELLSHSGGGSGGYLEHIFTYAAKECFEKTVSDIKYKTLRNKDFKEVTLQVDGKDELKFAAAYGFRNIQVALLLYYIFCLLLFSSVKRLPAHHCLSFWFSLKNPFLTGLLNGSFLNFEICIGRISHDYVVMCHLRTRNPSENQEVEQLYRKWLGGESSEKARKMLHTSYHEVEKLHTALNIKW
ncbi:PREDICTED: cytosolic Fe-S cluster assembly factor narfl-like [Acropora digitifera]|uniref:cytosolic Fe-S cluster assembly factor narfl-like n=1 Tax=Acropora digitifera TaxID=70779 RepID=UPI00077A8149|nr:PREDICTED: cytosolic Fe-S cluster assembly factor narfl-like [Acropora digitifera]